MIGRRKAGGRRALRRRRRWSKSAVATEVPRLKAAGGQCTCLSPQSRPLSTVPESLCPSALFHLATSIMATFQRLIVSLLVILTFTFVFFAQSSEAVKGPKITHKVHISSSIAALKSVAHLLAGLL